jgi:ABC-type sugar transport system ATPase subunit
LICGSYFVFIQFENITKSFGGVTALQDVSLSIERGECHALMGENGAGKSTLGKILAGIHRPDSGIIRIDDREVSFRSPRDAARAGDRDGASGAGVLSGSFRG